MKPYYYTFEWKDRVITLCLEYQENSEDSMDLYMGYSVKIPTDTNNEEFGKKIALGRCRKYTTRTWLTMLGDRYALCIRTDKGVLKAIARNCEKQIINGDIIIKGIR